MSLKKILNDVLSIANIKISRLPSKAQLREIERIKNDKEEARQRAIEEEKKKFLWLQQMNFATILDIGANIGQFAREMRRLFPEAMIYSFEPLPSCYEQLEVRFKHDTRYKPFNVALGDENGEVVMHRNEYSPSSSLLPMAELHKQAFDYTRNTVPETIKVVQLDSLSGSLNIISPLLVKIDVQGYEKKVIAGGRNILLQADLIICELSIEKLYEEQALFDEIYTILKELGFKYAGNYYQLTNPNDGRIIQVDGIFIRS